MPEIIPTIDKCQLPYSFASGNNVSNAIYVIIPATVAIKNPTKNCGKNIPKINYFIRKVMEKNDWDYEYGENVINSYINFLHKNNLFNQEWNT